MSIYHKINQSIPTYEDYDILCNDYFLWQKSAKTDSEASHKRYLSKYPNGYFSEQAQSRYRTLENQRIERERRQAEERKQLEEEKRKKEAQRKEQQRLKAEAKRKEDVAWKKAFDSLTIEVLNQYKEQYTNGRYVVQANVVIDDIKAWEFAKLKNTLSDYDEYLANFSDGLFVDKAEHGKELCIKQEDNAWQKAFDSLTIEALNQYKGQYPKGRYISNADETIEDIKAWEIAQTKNTIDSYHEYIHKVNGLFTQQAKNNKTSIIEEDKKVWEQAEEEKTLAGYQRYLEHNQHGEYLDIATKRIATLEKSILFKKEYSKDKLSTLRLSTCLLDVNIILDMIIFMGAICITLLFLYGAFIHDTYNFVGFMRL